MKGLFPNDKGAARSERLRVLRSDNQHTIMRLIRTETETEPEEWTLVPARLPEQWPEGYEFRITFTPMELEWLEGKRELERGQHE